MGNVFPYLYPLAETAYLRDPMVNLIAIFCKHLATVCTKGPFTEPRIPYTCLAKCYFLTKGRFLSTYYFPEEIIVKLNGKSSLLISFLVGNYSVTTT